MIILVTGVPGSGKTSKVVSELLAVKDRPIFVMGIPELKVPHVPVPPVEEWTRQEPTPEDATQLRPVFNFPENSIIVIDEAQNVYRPRAVGSKVPDIVAAFETHRHLGIDFYIITQHPSLIDVNVRRLVGKHWHVHIHPFGRQLLEWSGTRDPGEKSDRGDAIATVFKPPKSAFEHYKSAEVHTKIKRAFPKALAVFVVCLVASLALGYQIYQRVAGKNQPAPVAAVKDGPIKPIASSIPPGARINDAVAAEMPVIPDRPETAPIYDQLRVVKVMPVIVGCVSYADKCKCLTQQGTKADMSIHACRSWIASRPYNPYLDKPEPTQIAALDPAPGRQHKSAAPPTSRSDGGERKD